MSSFFRAFFSWSCSVALAFCVFQPPFDFPEAETNQATCAACAELTPPFVLD